MKSLTMQQSVCLVFSPVFRCIACYVTDDDETRAHDLDTRIQSHRKLHPKSTIIHFQNQIRILFLAKSFHVTRLSRSVPNYLCPVLITTANANMSTTTSATATDSTSSSTDSGIDSIILNHPMPMDSPEDFQQFISTPIIGIDGAATTTKTTVTEPVSPKEERKGWFFKRRQPSATTATSPTKDKECSLRWTPTSPKLLEQAESRILEYVRTPYRGELVDLGATNAKSKSRWCKGKTEERKMWTVVFNPDSPNTPLVLVHGLCAALGLWAMNIDELARDRPVYTIDLLGFGRSSRPRFPNDPMEAEANHVEAIEDWRREMKLDKFVLLGHSMGGFLSTGYALRYPDHVSHLVLADPWGFPKKPEGALEKMMETTKRPKTVKLITTIGQHVNALAMVRAAGPAGPGLIGKARPDLVNKFGALNNHADADGLGAGNGDQAGAGAVGQYIYHCNAQKPTGEEAFRTMMDFFGWAKNCMVNRIHELDSRVPVSLIYGGSTWLQHAPEEVLAAARPPGAFTKVYTLPEAGHHVYVDSMKLFNRIVVNICDTVGGVIGATTKTTAVQSL